MGIQIRNSNQLKMLRLVCPGLDKNHIREVYHLIGAARQKASCVCDGVGYFKKNSEMLPVEELLNLGQLFQNLFGMSVHFYLGEYLGDLSVLVNQEGGAYDTHGLYAVHIFFLPDTVFVDHFFLWIA